MLGKKFKDKQARAAELLSTHDPMTLAMALLAATEGESAGLDNGCGNNIDVEHLLELNLKNGAASIPEGSNNYQAFTRAMTYEQQENLLTAMMYTGTIAVHVDELKETFNVEDIYDNSGDGKRNEGMHDVEADKSKLTIIYCASVDD